MELVRVSRVNGDSIVYDASEGVHYRTDKDHSILEPIDDMAVLTASIMWRKPVDADFDDFDDDFDEDVDDIDDTEDFLEYWGISDKPYSSELNRLIVQEGDGRIFEFEKDGLLPFETYYMPDVEEPTIIPLDKDSGKAMLEWISEGRPGDYLDVAQLNPDEFVLFDEASREWDTTILDDVNDILLTASGLWQDTLDKSIRQEGQVRDWHGRYSGEQKTQAEKMFFPKGRLDKDVKVDLNPNETVNKYVADNSTATASGDVPSEDDAMFVAVVDPVDRTAVTDFLAISKSDNNEQPIVWVRRDGKWIEDSDYLKKFQSVTPPVTSIVEGADKIQDMIEQVDNSDNNSAINTKDVAAALENSDLSQVDKDSIIACALKHNVTEVIPRDWVRSPMNQLYSDDGTIIAAGVPGVADTPSDYAATQRLKNYWAYGKGTTKWLPGTKGDLTRLHNHLVKYVGPGRAWGLAHNIFKMHFGMTNNKYDKAVGS